MKNIISLKSCICNLKLTDYFIAQMKIIQFAFIFTLSFINLAGIQSQIHLFEPEQQRFELMCKSDTLLLSGMLSDELLYIHSNTLSETKKTHLLNIGSKKLHYKKIKVEEADFKKYGKLVLTNGIIRVLGTLNNTEFDVRLMYTAIYKKKKGKWQLLRWQSTKINT